MRFVHKGLDSAVLITTPDYPPKLGGLSTFTINIEKSLKSIGVEYDTLLWDNPKKLINHKFEKNYKYIIHIHFLPGLFLKHSTAKTINFFHGSEILFYSPNIIKKWIKRFLKKRMFSIVKNSHLNVFISDFTRKKLESFGHIVNYDRDIVFHNCIDTSGANFIEKKIEKEIRLVAIARDVPHKNLDGCVQFSKELALISGKKVNLAITSDNRWCSNVLNIDSLVGVSDEQRDSYFKNAHFNLLFSLDHSYKGFYEGFGLTVLEAGTWGVPSIVSGSGGLSESVHDKTTGWILPQFSQRAEIRKWWETISHDNYSSISKECFKHTTVNHSLKNYENFFKKVLR